MKHPYCGLSLHIGADKKLINRFFNKFIKDIPDDYIQFLLTSDGAHGVIGKAYIYLWSLSEIQLNNAEYEVNKYAPGILLIGSDGGGSAYAIDLRKNIKNKYVKLPFIGMSLDELQPYGKNFIDFLYTIKKHYS